MNFIKGWYVLYTKPKWERKISQILTEKKLETYLPEIKVHKQWSDRKKIIHKPLFPSYVFVKIDNKTEYYTSYSVKGVFSFVRFGNEYAIVSEEEIEQIKALISLNNLEKVELNNVYSKIGEKVKIKYGPFSGKECVVLRKGNKNKIIVKINSLNQDIVATVPLNFFASKKDEYSF